MSKKLLAVIFLCLLAVSFLVIAVNGSRYTDSYEMARWSYDPSSVQAEDCYVIADDPRIVEISNIRMEDSRLRFDLRALKRGTTFLTIGYQPEGIQALQKIYVHQFGIITRNSFFGGCTGGFMIPLSILVITVLLFADHYVRLRNGIRENLYSYSNIINFGVVVFLVFLIIKQVTVILDFQGIDASVVSVLSSAETFAYIVLPVAYVLFVLISLSNLNLMRKEGVNWHNMLGFFLGLILCLVTVLPDRLYGFLLTHQVVDIFNENGISTHLFSLFEHTVFYIVAYLECILLGTVVFSVRAARRVPAFDKDYILILGSRIRNDGTLPPLLQGRADRAVAFAEIQRKATGREIIFVPSGGRGPDEIMAEADAIRNYLVYRGVPEERILVENQSCSTWENIRNSMQLIAEDYGARNPDRAAGSENGESVSRGRPRTAFSTTNYHVFRSGLIASKMGFHLEGIGSPTRAYFWINAFIREFIATMFSEKKRHLRIIAALVFGVILLVVVNYLSVLL